MFNWFALLTVFFAATSIILFYAVLGYRDENKQLRRAANALWRANIAKESHLMAASELLHEYQLLERRNVYLQSCQNNFKGILAGARLAVPATLDEHERFTVRTEQEAP